MTDGYKPPSPDAKQDWKVTNLTEANGMVIMEFNRKQNTTDTEGDNVIGVSAHICLQRKQKIVIPFISVYIKSRSSHIHVPRLSLFLQ